MKQPLVLLLYVLTFTSGLIDAVSILGLGGVFTSLMTGNTVLIGLSLGGGAALGSALRSSLAIALFLFGAACAGRLAKRRKQATLRQWLMPTACVESGLLLAAAGVGFVAAGANGALPDKATLAMIGLISAAMGFRSATIKDLAVPELKTTVLTLTLTGLAADSPLGGNNPQRTIRRICSVLLLSGGALTGALLFNRWGVSVTLAAMAALVFGATIVFSSTAQAAQTLKQAQGQ